MTTKDKKQILLEKLFSLHRFGIKPGLERTLALLEICGNPHRNLKTIHIAGTNGKGSVAAILASILTEAGYKTGLYTSPHIKSFNERIRINGKMISDEDIVTIVELLIPKADEIGATFFEITTVAAFYYLAEHNVDIAVIETGMGGRYDSTNVLSPLLSVITNIGLEHKEYLGDTIQKIANEKAGIIKEDIPVVLGNIKDEIKYIFDDKSDNITYANDLTDIRNIQFLKDLKYMVDLKLDGVLFEHLKLNIAGYAQIENIMTAFAALYHIFTEYIISEENIRLGLGNIRKNTGITSRLDMTDRKMPLIMDVAHNPDSILNLVNTLDKSEYRELKWNILLAIMSDKDSKAIFDIIKSVTNQLIITKPAIDRATDIEILKSVATESGIDVVIIENPIEAFEYLKNLKSPAIVVGSFYLIGELC